MKKLSCKFLLFALSAVFLLSGCSMQKTAEKLDAVEEKVEQKVDEVKDAAKDAVLPKNDGSGEKAVAITAEKAQSIALEHAGLTADQVSGLRTEFEIDDRIPHYDVQFRQDHWEYEYEIHGETGEILSAEKDD